MSPPIHTKLHRDPRPGPQRVLLVMLPGMGISSQDFVDYGLVAMAQSGHQIVDVLATQPDQSLYLDGVIADDLNKVLARFTSGENDTRLWLLGISLGGMGALACAARSVARIEGLVLLAPFIGTRGTVAALQRAGGWNHWSPRESVATQAEQEVLCWLQTCLANPAGPPIWLGHATRDRFAAGHRMLAAALPDDRTVQVEGAHDWPAWQAQFQALMRRAPFG